MPKVLFWSSRKPAVTNNRSRKAKVCSKKKPALTLNVDDSSAPGTAPAVTVVAPGGSTEELAPLRAKMLRKYCAPKVVLDATASDK